MKKWKHISEIHKDGIRYIENRRDGLVKSIATPWASFNESGTDGLEWGTIITIGGRPGSGKTAIVSQITRNAHKLNPDQDFAVLDFQFEMSSKTTAVREFSHYIKRTYKQLLGVGRKVTDTELAELKAYASRNVNKDIYQIDDPMTVNQMEKTILEFIEEVGKPVIVTIDHSVLVKKDASDKDKFEMLYNLGEMLTNLKKRLPIIFIVLTQMNRTIEDQTRKVPGTIGNFPTTSDVFGADALLQHSDILIALNQPSRYYINVYGPEKFVMEKDTLAMHFLKTRNGDNTLCFFDAKFEHMSIVEIVPPTKQTVPNRRGAGTSTGYTDTETATKALSTLNI